MNKNDCEHIGFIFSKLVAGEIDQNEMIAAIATLDLRIKEEFELFGDVRERDEAIMNRFIDLMEEKFGDSWALLEASKDYSKEFWAQAEAENPL